MNLTFCYRHIAPYHHARLLASQLHGPVTVIEYGNVNGVAFEEYEGLRPYTTIRLQTAEDDWYALYQALEKASPDILLLPGWGFNYTLAALCWALENMVPAVVISDSNETDKSRYLLSEFVKSHLVRLFSSGLVAGKRSMEYLMKLGMKQERIFIGCDVVDNKYFAVGADTARHDSISLRKTLGLPEKFFLAVNRIVPEKNVLRLLQAYSTYRRDGAPGDWKLVLIGEGELRLDIERARTELDLEDHVFMLGIKKYEELPSFYGLATAFVLSSICEPWGLVVNEAMAAGLPVLVSNRCGCVPDLVEDMYNGYSFDPLDINELSLHMLKMGGEEYNYVAMGNKSREIISRWTPEVCAKNVWKAAEMAMHSPYYKASLIDKLLVRTVKKTFARGA